MHYVRAHKVWRDQQIERLDTEKRLDTNKIIKDRWTIEEKKMLAREEATLNIKQRNDGKRLYINQALNKIFGNRTIESIKGIRKRLSHKGRVQQVLEEGSSSSEDENNSFQDTISEESEDHELRSYVANLDDFETKDYNYEMLHNLCRNIHRYDTDIISDIIATYIRETFPPKNKIKRKNKIISTNSMTNMSKRRKRKIIYAITQKLWKKDRSRCWKAIEAEQLGAANPVIDRDIIEPYWKKLMTRNLNRSPNLTNKNCETFDYLWKPIDMDEIVNCFPPRNTAPGPDGMNARILRSIPLQILIRILNIFMICGKVPEQLLKSKTILIPKNKSPKNPGEFRPITISSVMVRLFHRVLAKRLNTIKIDERQRAFRDTDGCNDNIFILDMVLRYQYHARKEVFIASTDIAKAFDSVSFEALQTVMVNKGIPAPMIKYIMNMYKNSTTQIEYGGWVSDPINPTCGVKQGDPMSPVLFNLIIDEMIKYQDNDIGVCIGNMQVNIMAFADDLILIASTQRGLQHLIDQTTKYLYNTGLEMNASKCCSIAIKSLAKQKLAFISDRTKFSIMGKAIPVLSRADQMTYLGVPFSPEGRLTSNVREMLQLKLLKMNRAALKPQQRLWILTVAVIPSLMYHLTTGAIKVGLLKTLDKDIRKMVRKWLDLPKDCPTGYFYAQVADGGLGVTSLRWTAPLQRKQRLEALNKSSYITGNASNEHITKEIEICNRRLTYIDNETNAAKTIQNNIEINKRWAKMLYGSVDGGALKDSANTKNQHSWVNEGTQFLSGADYIKSIKLRINALPTLSRTKRGMTQSRACRAGCGVSETYNHISQECHRTHGMRIKRHDAIVKYVARSLNNQKYKVNIEPHIKTSEGLKKPDIIVIKQNECWVIDAQVVSEQTILDEADKNKKKKYSTNSMKTALRDNYDLTTNNDIKTMSITLNCRGVWSKKSAQNLLENEIIAKKDLKVISSRVIIGGIAAFKVFNKSTLMRRPRTGIG